MKTFRYPRRLAGTSVAKLLVALLLFTGALGGCEQVQEQVRELMGEADEAPEAPSAPESVEFEVDASGVIYATLLDDDSLDGADRLSRVPLSERAATVVHVANKTPQLDGQYYVADLLESKPGDRATAKLRSADQVRARLDAGTHGALGGLHALRAVEQMLGISQTESDAPSAQAAVRSRSKRGRSSEAAADNERSKSAAKTAPSNEDHVIELFDGDEISKEKSSVESASVDGHAIEIRRLGSGGSTSSGNARSSGSAKKASAKSARVPAGTRWRPVTLYYADWCGVCKKAQAWLDANNVPYTPVDIEASEENQRQMAQFCRSRGAKSNSIPTFRIGDDIMQGWGEARFMELAMRP